MRLRSAELALLGVIIVFSLFLTMAPTSRAEDTLAEPSLVTVLNTLGYTNIALSSAQTFPAGTYEARLLAEFAGYCDTNEFSYYSVGTSNFVLLFSGPEGNYGYITPPVTKTFSSTTTFGCSMYVAAESHRYFTQTSRNPDGKQHAKVYENLDQPGMYFIGFENLYGSASDRDFQDMVVSICPPLEHYLTVKTQPLGVTTIPGEGWYSHGTDVILTAPETVSVSTGVRYSFSYWDVDGASQGAGVNPVTVHMDANHTATAHYTLQYYLTVTSPYGVPGGQGWYDSGSSAYATLDAGTVDHGNGTRRVFTSWSGDASGTNYAQSNSILMDAPKTAVANWKTQYYLTMSTNFGTVSPGNGWHDAGSTFSISATPPSTVSGERYAWNGWSGTGSGSYTGTNNPVSITMNAPINEVASWTHQYRLTMTTNYGTTTPSIGEHWYAAGSMVDISATAPSTITGERYVWNGWTGAGTGSYTGPNNSVTIAMNAPITQTASWTHQYYLTVISPFDTPGGEGWYDSGSSTYATLAVSTVDHGNGTRRIFVSWSENASGINYAQSNPILMNGPKTAIANWKTQYLLTLATNPSGITTPSGGGWFDSGTYATISTTGLVDIIPGSSGYKFNDWTTADMPEIADPSSPSTTVFMDKPKTVTANYKTQYYLTITYTSGGVTDPASSGWYNAGTTASVTAIPDPDYVLNRWELDGSPAGSTNPYNLLMNSAHTLHAVFEYSAPPPTEYYLTVKTDPLGIASISGQGWYDEGEDVTLTAPGYVDVSSGTRYEFAYWDVDGTPRSAGVNPIIVNMDANHTATAHYTLQYYLAVTSPYGATSGQGWHDSGVTAYADLNTGTIDHGNGTRRMFTSWSGDASGTNYAQSNPITMNAPKTAVANWKTQYYLTVQTVPSGIVTIPGEGWYDKSATVPLTAPDVTGYEFRYWDVDGPSQGNGVKSISVTMNIPHTATAHYAYITVGGYTTSIRSALSQIWTSVNSIIVAAFIATAFYTERRRKKN